MKPFAMHRGQLRRPAMALWLLCNAALVAGIQATARSAAAEHAVSAHRRVQHGAFALDELGVRHFVMQGNMVVGEDEPQRVFLHIWLKGLLNADALRIRGFAFAEPVDEDVTGWSPAECSQRAMIVEWRPRIFLRSVASGTEFNVSAHNDQLELEDNGRGGVVVTLPLQLEAEVPVADSKHELEFHIAGWERFVLYSPHLFAVRQPEVPEGPPRVFNLLPPGWDVDVAMSAMLLRRSLEYHTALGFAGAIQLLSLAHFQALTQEPQLQPFLTSGQLTLVLFADLPEVAGRRRCYKPYMYSVGLLSQWGHNALVFVADIDEYFATPNAAATLEASIHGFMADATLATLMLTRYNTVCDVCSGDDPETAELGYWTHHQAAGDHPVKHYNKRAQLPFQHHVGKTLVHADRTLGFQVHWGAPLPGFRKDAMPREHAFVMHMYSLFQPRRQTLCGDCEVGGHAKPLEFDVDSEWTWPMQHVHGPQRGAARSHAEAHSEGVTR